MSPTSRGNPVVCLVRPPGVETFRIGTSTLVPPLGLAYVAGALETAGCAVHVIDALAEAPRTRTRYFQGYLVGLPLADIAARVPADALVVGITCMFTHEWPMVVHLVRLIKERRPEVCVVVGGEHVTAMPEFSLVTSRADALVLGEGEETTTELVAVNSRRDLENAVRNLGLPAILKTCRLGYDGKGQAIIREGDDPDLIWADLGTKSAILEAFIPFEREISVIAARGADGHVECFDVTENEHRDHILKFSTAPAAISEALAAQARGIAEKIASALDYVGALAVEMFVVPGGGGTTLLVNEIAPRVHNSGHWTLDGASVSQFEQHIRAIAGWPLGKPVRHGPVTMTNLIGDDINDYERWLTVPGATVHLYGKGPARPGRKMGHITEVGGRPKTL